MIEIKKNGKSIILENELEEKKSLLEILREEKIEIFAYCGGRGTCGKCKVRVIEGELPITKEDELKFSYEELNSGYRLACKAFPKKDCVIAIEEEIQGYEILGANEGVKDPLSFVQKKSIKAVSIGIDIGTTTMALAAVVKGERQIITSTSLVNPLRGYGADVLSRMQASNGGKKEEMKEKLRESILEGIKGMLRKAKIPYKALKEVVIAGNTTMGHLLMGYSCESLGSFPFTPVNISFIEGSIEEILGGTGFFDGKATLLPGISAFVGADISAGLYLKEFHKKQEVNLLVDLGTNGEMAIGNCKGILTTSAAAGPAFEGGNITCGMGSVRGAISRVNIQGDKVLLTTIGDASPVGICGTGVIDTVCELRKNKYMDKTGLLIPEYFDRGYVLGKGGNGEEISFYQKDIREIQLAKAAIRAGIELLLKRYGIAYKEIHKVYLAGGFGFKLDVKKAGIMGLLPQELIEKVEAIGNSSLEGALKYIHSEHAREEMEQVVALCEEKHLATDEEFQGIYLESMYFQ